MEEEKVNMVTCFMAACSI